MGYKHERQEFTLDVFFCLSKGAVGDYCENMQTLRMFRPRPRGEKACSRLHKLLFK